MAVSREATQIAQPTSVSCALPASAGKWVDLPDWGYQSWDDACYGGSGSPRRIGEGSSAMPREESAPAIKALTCALWQAWTKAGPVSYAEFEKMSRRVLG